MDEELESHGVFSVVKWDEKSPYLLSAQKQKVCKDTLDEVLQNIASLKNNKPRQDFFDKKTEVEENKGASLSELLHEMQNIHLTVSTHNFKHVSSCMWVKLSKNRNMSKAGLMLHKEDIDDDNRRETIIGHEFGHVVYALKQNWKNLELLNQRFTDSEVSDKSLLAINSYENTGLIASSRKATVEKNWEQEKYCDFFAATVNPNSANIGHVNGFEVYTTLYLNGMLPECIAHFLANACEMRDKQIIKTLGLPSESKLLKNVAGLFLMNLSDIHPCSITRTFEDAQNRKELQKIDKI